MTYTVTCPDSDCRTVFDVDEELLDLETDESDPITCPECGQDWEWEFDKSADPPLKLVELVDGIEILEDLDEDDEDDGDDEG